MSKLTDITQCTAHPHVDHDGTIFNVGSLYGIKTHYTFFRIRPTPGTKQCSTFGENSLLNKYNHNSSLFISIYCNISLLYS